MVHLSLRIRHTSTQTSAMETPSQYLCLTLNHKGDSQGKNMSVREEVSIVKVPGENPRSDLIISFSQEVFG